MEGFLHHPAIFIKYKNRVLTPLKTIKIGREPCKTEFFECSFRSPKDRPEIMPGFWVRMDSLDTQMAAILN